MNKLKIATKVNSPREGKKFSFISGKAGRTKKAGEPSFTGFLKYQIQ
jgi:hypothetical protein